MKNYFFIEKILLYFKVFFLSKKYFLQNHYFVVKVLFVNEKYGKKNFFFIEKVLFFLNIFYFFCFCKSVFVLSEKIFV